MGNIRCKIVLTFLDFRWPTFIITSRPNGLTTHEMLMKIVLLASPIMIVLNCNRFTDTFTLPNDIQRDKIDIIYGMTNLLSLFEVTLIASNDSFMFSAHVDLEDIPPSYRAPSWVLTYYLVSNKHI